MINPFAALLFDMDGLLLDTERLFMESLVDLACPMGYDEGVVRRFFLGQAIAPDLARAMGNLGLLPTVVPA